MKNFYIIFIITLLLPAPAFAARTPTLTPIQLPDTLPLQNLQITPIISDLHLIPGQDTVVPLTIRNLTDQPLGIHAEVSNVSDSPQTQSIEQHTQSPILSWTQIASPDAIMGSQEKKIISVVIHTPQNAPDSGYAEIIYFTPFVDSVQQPEGAPVVLSRIGALILSTVGTLNYDDLYHKTSITSFSSASFITDHVPVILNFGVANKYFTYYTAKPFLTITPLFGKPQTMLLSEHHILPGKIEYWSESITPSSYHLLYFAHLAVSIGNGKQLYADATFLVFPYKIFLVLFGILLLISCIYIIYKIKKNIRKAWKILLRGN